MGFNHYDEIDEVIMYIQHHLEEPLSLEQLARYVSYSPFHFARIFKERTGLSPMYYVSSLRLQKAKQLLLQTNLSVRDIGMEIGQQSLGTFTTRFTDRVGISPGLFRDSKIKAYEHFIALKNLNNWSTIPSSNQHTTVRGTVNADVSFNGVILLGLFPKPIPEGFPIYGTLLPQLGEFVFFDVKPGVYYLMGTSVEWEMKTTEFLLPHSTLRTRSKKPIIVGSSPIPQQHVTLHSPRIDDPPILISLPLLMSRFLNRISRNSNL